MSQMRQGHGVFRCALYYCSDCLNNLVSGFPGTDAAPTNSINRLGEVLWGVDLQQNVRILALFA